MIGCFSQHPKHHSYVAGVGPMPVRVWTLRGDVAGTARLRISVSRGLYCRSMSAAAAARVENLSVSEISQKKQTVFVVDDDQAVRHAMSLLLESVDLECEIFASGNEFLEKIATDPVGCLVLDIRMPGLGGLELQQLLNDKGSTLPIIFVTGHGDVPMAVDAMQKGAVDFIQKPFRDQELLDCINEAFKANQVQRDSQLQKLEVAESISKLTKRESEVMDLVVTGKPNKIMAYELGVSQRTVEIHRARVMEKMGARSLADLVKIHLSS